MALHARGAWSECNNHLDFWPDARTVAAAGGQLPMFDGGPYEEMVQEVVWQIARAFGFQVGPLLTHNRRARHGPFGCQAAAALLAYPACLP